MGGELNISREFAELRDRCRALRQELIKLITHRDELLAAVKPNLEARYYALIGKEQYRLFTVRNEVLRLRRKIELIQASRNRGERPDPELIERLLDEELKQWIEELRDLGRKIEWAEYHNRLPALSAAEARELKKTYRELVRKLHPDFNEALPENFQYLWERVLTAYRNGDLEELQTLMLLLSEQGRCFPEEPNTLEQLAADAEKMEKKIRAMLECIAGMQEQFPFNYRDKLDDAGWIAAQQEAVLKQIEDLERRRQSYLAVLAAPAGGGSSFTVH